MKIDIRPDKQELGRHAAKAGAELIRKAINEYGKANVNLIKT